MVFDAGPLGYLSLAAHGHADALSFCLAVDGDWWLVDPGTYAYHSEPRWRDYFRGTSAHNALVVDGLSQSEMGGAFLWTRHAGASIQSSGMDSALQFVEGMHNGYLSQGVIHRRRIEFSPQEKCVVIQDILEGEGLHHLAIYFHFAPEIAVGRCENGQAWLATRSRASQYLRLEVDGAWCWETVCGDEVLPLGWYSPKLEKKVPAVTLRGERLGAIPLEVCTRIVLTELIKGEDK